MSNFGQLKTRVTRKLGLDSTSGSDEQDMIGEHLNEAVVEILLETHCRLARSTAALTSGSEDYELDTDILAIHEIIDSGGIPLVRVTETEMHNLRQGAATSTSSMRYAVAGSNMLMVWPEPSSTQTLTIYYVPRPTAMSSATHDPSTATYGGIPSEHHKAIEFYALWQGADYDDDNSSGQGDRYLRDYSNALSRIKKDRVFKGGRVLPRSRLARQRRTLSSPSEDARW